LIKFPLTYTFNETRLHNHAFDNIYEGEELANALEAHAGMGYNYVVSSIHVASSLEQTDEVDVDVVVTQMGVAPFYYELSLVLSCPDIQPQSQEGVNTVIDEGDSQVFSFLGIPATADCLGNVMLSLESPYAYADRPVRFAQGVDGTVQVNVPEPPVRYPGQPSRDPGAHFTVPTLIEPDGKDVSSKSNLGALFGILALMVCLGILVSILCACLQDRKTPRMKQTRPEREEGTNEDKSKGSL
jgi:hypothetical protein